MRSLMTWKPLSPMTASTDTNLDRFIDEFFAPVHTGWTPAADIEEHEDHYLVSMDLPGLRKEDIRVTIEDGTLSVAGTRKSESKEERGNVVRTERFAGEFQRTFRLGSRVSTSDITAEYRDGVLSVKVAKAAEARQRAIEVR